MMTTNQPNRIQAVLLTVLILLLAFVAAYRVGAQEQNVQQDQRIKDRLNPNAASAVTTIVESARSIGLPTEPLIQKALQGAAKGADDERIAAVVGRFANDMNSARNALGAQSLPAELEAGASALRSGVKPEELTKLRQAQPTISTTPTPQQRPLVIALATVSDLVARGVPANVAASAITALVARGATDSDIIQMRRNVDRDISAGLSPASAATIRSRPISTSTTTRTTRPASTTIRRPAADGGGTTSGDGSGGSGSGGTRPRRGG